MTALQLVTLVHRYLQVLAYGSGQELTLAIHRGSLGK